MNMLVEFCIPVLNEEAILRKNILYFFQFCNSREFDFDWRITILLNGCSDNSLKIAKQLDQEYDRVTFFELQEKGKGKVLKEYGKISDSDIFFYMDIDLAVSPEHIPLFIDFLLKDSYDLVIGSRLLPESNVKRSFLREMSSRGYSFASGLLIKDGIKDRQCGFKAIKTEFFQRIIPFVHDDQWFFDTELLAKMNREKARIKELPVDWRENRYDQRKSKIRISRDSVKFLKELIKLKIELSKNGK
jgi:glycosyltransferase involved in cell wall biosynthesis